MFANGNILQLKKGEKVMFNKQELKSVMALFGDNQETLASALGKRAAAISAKINGKREFTIPEVDAIARRYNLSAEALKRIFFASDVP